METIIVNKQSYKLEISENGICLYLWGEESNKVATNLLLIPPIIINFILIGSFIYMASLGEGIPIGFIISCIVGLGTSAYFIKLFLWNKYGQEVFLLEKDKFISYDDYNFFKDNYQSHGSSLSQFYIVNGMTLSKVPKKPYSKYKNGMFQIAFLVNGVRIISKNKLPIETIMKIREAIDHWK